MKRDDILPHESPLGEKPRDLEFDEEFNDFDDEFDEDFEEEFDDEWDSIDDGQLSGGQP